MPVDPKQQVAYMLREDGRVLAPPIRRAEAGDLRWTFTGALDDVMRWDYAYSEGERGRPPEEQVRSEILTSANQMITTDRHEEHGDAADNFRQIATYWSAHLDTDVSASDVAVMMTLLKLARIKNTPANRDHWTDVAGYAALGGEINAPNT